MSTYIVKKGDTLRGIALSFYNDAEKYVLIQEVNNIQNPNLIQVGQAVNVPEESTRVNDLTSYHNAFGNGVRWRLTEEGIYIEGSGIERTPGAPVTTGRIWETYLNPIDKWAEYYNIPCELIIATIATESEGVSNALRREPGYISDNQTPNKISIGVMQTLISTARSTLNDPSVDRDWLFDPRNSIQAGTCYIAEQRSRTLLDPPKVACSYNAGGVYHNNSAGNRWRMTQYPIGSSEHCDRFVKWFNDAVYVLKNHSVSPFISYTGFYGI